MNGGSGVLSDVQFGAAAANPEFPEKFSSNLVVVIKVLPAALKIPYTPTRKFDRILAVYPDPNNPRFF